MLHSRGRTQKRRLGHEGLEFRRMLAVDITATLGDGTSISNLYEGGASFVVAPDANRYSDALIEVFPDPSRSVESVQFEISGDLAAVGMEPGSGSSTTIPADIGPLQTVIGAVEDDDLIDNQVTIKAVVHYDDGFSPAQEESSALVLTLKDNDHSEEMLLIAADSTAKEPVEATPGCGGAEPADTGVFGISVPEHWMGGSVVVQVRAPSPGETGIAELGTDYTLSLEPLPLGVDSTGLQLVALPNGQFRIDIPSKVYFDEQGNLALRNFDQVVINVTPLGPDAIEGGEIVEMSLVPEVSVQSFGWNENELFLINPESQRVPYPYTEEFHITISGNASVTILDGLPSEADYDLATVPTEVLEFEQDTEKFPTISITPFGRALCESHEMYLSFAGPGPNAGSSQGMATPGSDYSLEFLDGSPLMLSFNEVEQAWISERFAAPREADRPVEIVVIPVNDRQLEGDETLAFDLYVVSTEPAFSDQLIGSSSASITEEYLESIEDTFEVSDSCTCTCTLQCPSNGPEVNVDNSDGSLAAKSMQFPLEITSSPINSFSTLLMIGLPLAKDKVVPDSIDLAIDLIDVDQLGMDNNYGTGSQSVTTIVSFTIAGLLEGTEPASPGDVIWLPAVVNLGDFGGLTSSPENRNALGDILANLRLTAHPNFSDLPWPTEMLFSGWTGEHSTTIINGAAGDLDREIPGNGGGEAALTLATRRPVVGPPGVRLFGSSRAIVGANSLAPLANAGIPIDPNGSAGNAARYQARVSSKSTPVVISSTGRATVFDDSGNSFTSLSVFEGNPATETYKVTDRFGSVSSFDSTGRLQASTDPNGNTTTYAYGGVIVGSMTDPFGNEIRLEIVEESITPTGDGSVLIYKGTYVTDRSDTISVDNRTVMIQWNQTQTSIYGNSGTLIIRGDDPDDWGPRHALEERFIFSGGNLSRIERHEVGGQLLQSIDLATSIFAGTEGSTGRVRSTISRQDGASKTIDFPFWMRPSYTIQNAETLYDARAALSGNSSGANLWYLSNSLSRSPFQDALGSSTDWNGNRSVYKLDIRGRILQFWDPIQVESLLRDLIPSDRITQQQRTDWLAGLDLFDSQYASRFQSTTADFLSYRYVREQPEQWWNVHSLDLGEITQAISPDPDDFSLRNFPLAQQINHSQDSQVISYAYTDDKNLSSQLLPKQFPTLTTYDQRWDVPITVIDETGTLMEQVIDSATGRVLSRTYLTTQAYSLRHNTRLPLDVNADGSVSPVDSLQVIHAINQQAAGIPADFSTRVTPYFDTNGDGVLSVEDFHLINDFLSGLIEPPASSQIATTTDYVYLDQPGFPQGVLRQIRQLTGRESGWLITEYSYINDPSKAAFGKLNSVTYAAGSSQPMIYSFTYDDRGRLQTETDPAGRITRYYYDRIDRLVAVEGPDPDGDGPLLPPTVRYDYNTLGNLIATETINSVIQTQSNGTEKLIVTALVDGFEYDSNQRIVGEYQQRASETWYLLDGFTGIFRTLDETRTGARIDISSLHTYLNGNPSILNSPVPGTPNSYNIFSKYPGRVVTNTYDNNGNLLSAIERDDELPGSERTTTIEYDPLDRPVRIETPDPILGVASVPGEQRSNSNGFVTHLNYDNVGNLYSTIDALGRMSSFTYDSLSRPANMTYADGSSESYNYTQVPSGWLVSAVDAEGRETAIRTDFRGNVVETTSENLHTQASYWNDGLLRSMTDEGGHTTDYLYDDRGMMSAVLQPRIGRGSTRPTTSFQYTIDGLLASTSDPLGRTTTYSYYSSGLRDRIIYPDPDGNGPLLPNYSFYEYDSLGNLVAFGDAQNDPRVLDLAEEHQPSRIEYNSRYWPVKSIDELGRSDASSYDNFGNVTTFIDSQGNETNYVYDSLDKLVSETQRYINGTSESLLTQSYRYDGLGLLRELTDRENRSIEYDYDSQNRLVLEGWLSENSDYQRTFEYAYDATGNLIALQDSDDWGTDFQFAYDTRNQLQLEKQSIPQLGTQVVLDRDYDNLGNRTRTALNFGGNFDPSSQLSPTQSSPIGGGIWDLENTYFYDSLNRLVKVSQTGINSGNAVAPKSASFEYDLSSNLVGIQRFNVAAADPLIDHLVAQSTFAYDAAGRLTSIIHSRSPLAFGTTWQPDGGMASSTSPSNAINAFALKYDPFNQLASLASLSDDQLTNYSYDEVGQLVDTSESRLDQSVSLHVKNPSFELPVLSGDGDWTSFPIEGWQKTGITGVADYGTAQFTAEQATDGQQTAYSVDGVLSQILDASLIASHRYQLSVDVGDRLDVGFPGYSVGLYAGGVLLAEATEADFAGVDGAFVEVSVFYTTANTVAPNQHLEIRLASDGWQTIFDNVRLTATPTNEIPIANASFESPGLVDGAWDLRPIPGWQKTGTTGVYNPTAQSYDGRQASQGQQVALVVDGTISQVLTSTLVPMHRYQLEVDVGDRLTHKIPSYRIGLYAGGVLLSEISGSDVETLDGGFVKKQVSYESLSDVGIGQPLEIRLTGVGWQTNFDNVRLTSEPIVSIPLENASFELPALAGDGTWDLHAVPGWTKTGTSGVHDPNANQYPERQSTDGRQVALLVDGEMTQQLNTRLSPNSNYLLSVDIGDRQDMIGLPNYRVELWAGSQRLAYSTKRYYTGHEGEWTTVSIAYSTGAQVPEDQLAIKLISDGWLTHFDNVRLTVSNPHYVPVVNASFESPRLSADGTWTELAIEGWQKTGISGVLNPTSAQYSQRQASDGVQTAFLVTGEFSQSLDRYLAANHRYQVQVDVGDRLDLPLPFYAVDLLAGSTVLASVNNAEIPSVNGQFVTATLTYDSTLDQGIGERLSVRLRSSGWQANFDNVRITDTPMHFADIMNSSFETPVLADGDDSFEYAPSWQTTFGAYILNPSNDMFVEDALPHGSNVLLGENDGVNDATASQILTEELRANHRYELSVEVGAPLRVALSPDYSIGIYAGGMLLGEVTEEDFPTVMGEFITATVVAYSPAVIVPGQALEIRFTSHGQKTAFDSVRFASSSVEVYAYDDEGNRVDGSGTTSARGTHNRIQQDSYFSYEYDADGNLTQRTSLTDGSVTAYAWDHRHRLVQVQSLEFASGPVTQTVEYTYDAFDRRTVKRLDANGDGTFEKYWAYIHDGDETLVQLEDADGDSNFEGFRVVDRYMYGAAVDMVLSDEQYAPGSGPILAATTSSSIAGETLWLLRDHLGSIRDVIDSSSNVRQHVVYDSFGRRTDEQDYGIDGEPIDGADPLAVDVLFGYTGRDWDEDTQLQNNRARWYDPAQGRWLSQDPMGFSAGDANLYRYVGNGPTSRTDPSGLDWEWAWEWHHLLPREVFEKLSISGVNINASEYGYMLRGIDHRGAGVGVHAQGWNDDWARWVTSKLDDGIEITKEMVDKRLAEMICEFDLPNKGFAARYSFEMRTYAYKAAHEMWMKGRPINSHALTKGFRALREAGEAIKIRIPRAPVKGLGGPAGFIIVVIGGVALGSEDPLGNAIDGVVMTSRMGDAEYHPPNWDILYGREYDEWNYYQQELDALDRQRKLMSLEGLAEQAFRQCPPSGSPHGQPSRREFPQ
ncbi:MAG: hypothetical protein KDB03_06710 [Planctomycetales bacterium]|nr:hypothetical protein [Planctomycetales bacterium]